jgi:hypothetical protein
LIFWTTPALAARHGWSLPPSVAASRWRLPAARSDEREQAMLPDPTDGAGASPSLSPPPDFSVAPSVSNILNRRDDLIETETGVPGSGAGYLRSVGRTLGVAVKRALY